ncbi:MAG TPA: RDD family protein [Candidatus Dormibacteraeota bacterium]|nr:RDD family protein [Candidatus Dormibacteraeota bacterium]
MPAGGAGVLNTSAAELGAATYTPVHYSGFWLRFVAYIIDSFVMSLAYLLMFIPFLLMTGLGAALAGLHSGQDPQEIVNMVGPTFILGLVAMASIAFLAGWLYHAMLESSDWQATLGKRAMGLIVTDLAGQPISFARASARYFAKIISSLIPLGIGYILAGFTPKKQAIHDMITNCLVLRDAT